MRPDTAVPGVHILCILVVLVTMALLLGGMAYEWRKGTHTSDLIVDHCALEEYRQECDMTAGGDLGTPDELQACFAKARQEAVRIAAGVPVQCRGK